MSLLACLAVLACRDPLSPAERWENATTEARARWVASNTRDYAFTAFRSCECIPGAVGPARVVVRNGTIESVTDVQSGAPLAHELWFDIDALFDLIEREIVMQPHLLEVTFDSVRGYPTRVRYGEIEVDAGAIITVSGFATL